MSESAPPGWYPDASAPGYERWWDGATWSHVTRPADAPAAPSPVDPSAQAPGYGQSAYPQAPGYGQSAYPPAPGYGQAPGYPPAPGYQAYPGQPYGAYPSAPGMDPASVYFLAKRTPDGVALADQGMRLLARLIDYVVLSIVIAPLTWGWLTDYFSALNDYSLRAEETGESDPFGLLSQPGVTADLFKISVVSLLVTFFFEIGFNRFLGGTPGKLACGLRVREYDRPGKPSWGGCVLRWLVGQGAPAIIGLFWLLDVLWCTWDPKRQCLHDKAGSTVVVKAR